MTRPHRSATGKVRIRYGLSPKQSSFGIHAVVTSHYFEGGFAGTSRVQILR